MGRGRGWGMWPSLWLSCNRGVLMLMMKRVMLMMIVVLGSNSIGGYDFCGRDLERNSALGRV